MQRVTRKRTLARVGILIAGLGITAGGWSKEEANQAPTAAVPEPRRFPLRNRLRLQAR